MRTPPERRRVDRWITARFSCLVVTMGGLVGCMPAEPAQVPPAVAPSEPLGEAKRAFDRRDFALASARASAFLRDHPTDRPALSLLGRSAQLRGMNTRDESRWKTFRESADALRKLREVGSPLAPEDQRLLAVAFYNDACALARMDRPEAALAALTEAVEAGYADGDHLAIDEDLEPIRDRPEFSRVVHDAGLRGANRLLAVTRPFPFRARGADLKGKPIDTDTLRGKVILIPFLASWSPPCLREAPFLADLSRKLRANGLEILGLCDESETDPAARFPSPFPLLKADESTRKLLPRWDGYPTTLILDRKGRVRGLIEGFGDEDIRLITEAVAILLDEQP